MIRSILRTLWLILCCGFILDVIIILGMTLWHLFFDKDDGTHITKSVRKIWEEDEDDN